MVNPKNFKTEKIKEYTFDEWKSKGYIVIKGEKSKSRNNDNKATFTEFQVELKTNFKNNLNNAMWDLEYEYEYGD